MHLQDLQKHLNVNLPSDYKQINLVAVQLIQCFKEIRPELALVLQQIIESYNLVILQTAQMKQTASVR
jgi:hypothetical protein